MIQSLLCIGTAHRFCNTHHTANMLQITYWELYTLLHIHQVLAVRLGNASGAEQICSVLQQKYGVQARVFGVYAKHELAIWCEEQALSKSGMPATADGANAAHCLGCWVRGAQALHEPTTELCLHCCAPSVRDIEEGPPNCR